MLKEQSKTKYLFTKGVQEYRSTIPKFINSKDIVLEVGFAWGTTCNILSKYAGKVVGIDKGESYYEAVKTYPDLELYKIDGFDIGAVLSLKCKFNKIYIDISGCREVPALIKIIQMYEAVYKPELIVVKSTRLKVFVSKSKVWDNPNKQ